MYIWLLSECRSKMGMEIILDCIRKLPWLPNSNNLNGNSSGSSFLITISLRQCSPLHSTPCTSQLLQFSCPSTTSSLPIWPLTFSSKLFALSSLSSLALMTITSLLNFSNIIYSRSFSSLISYSSLFLSLATSFPLPWREFLGSLFLSNY
jgi:hypothetical protein